MVGRPPACPYGCMEKILLLADRLWTDPSLEAGDPLGSVCNAGLQLVAGEARTGDDVSTGRLRRSAAIELAVAGVVLAVTAVLVATATPERMPEMAGNTDPSAVTPTP